MPDQSPRETTEGKRGVIQAPRFARSKRKLPSTVQREVDEDVKKIVVNPLAGEPKTGAFKGIRVVKFKGGPLQLLLAYQFDPKRNLVEVLDVGAARELLPRSEAVSR